MTYRDIDPKYAGIYIFKNNINGKCYIGQSVCIRSRIKKHFYNIKVKNKNQLLYRAIEKYGLHNFTIDILEKFELDESLSKEELIKKLDALEIKYIKEYDSYNNGYNCTIGGDYGVLGLKMTEQQKKNISKISKANAVNFYKPIYMYNTKDNTTIMAISITAAGNITKIDRTTISKAANNIYKKADDFIVAHSKEELEIKIRQNQNSNSKVSANYKARYSIIIKYEDKEVFCNNTIEAAKYINCSRSMIYAVLNKHRKLEGIELIKVCPQADFKAIATEIVDRNHLSHLLSDQQ